MQTSSWSHFRIIILHCCYSSCEYIESCRNRVLQEYVAYHGNRDRNPPRLRCIGDIIIRFCVCFKFGPDIFKVANVNPINDSSGTLFHSTPIQRVIGRAWQRKTRGTASDFDCVLSSHTTRCRSSRRSSSWRSAGVFSAFRKRCTPEAPG